MKKSAVYQAFHDKEKDLRFFAGDNGNPSPHFHRCIEILYITEGKLLGEVDGQSFYAEKDDIIFVRPCGIHSLTPYPAYKNHVLIIKSAYADDFASVLEKETLPPLLSDKKYNRTILPDLKRLKNPAEQENFLIAKGLIDIIMGKFFMRYKRLPVVTTPNLSMIINVLNYIDEHFAEPITLDSTSSVFGYNKYYFSRLFNKYIGETLNSYINNVRINNIIARGKKQENMNLSQLVFDCGFDSMTTFYRSYSRRYDKPPTQIIHGGN